MSAAAAGASVTPVAADVRGGDAHDNHNTQSTDISQAARDRAEYAALAPRTVALIERLARVSFAVEDAPALDAAALALRCERARVYGAARADCPIDNPFEGVCAAGGLARRGELMRVLESARDGVDELATLMSELRARGVRKVTLEDLDALRAALQAASSARLLPESWLGERDGARLRALCAGLRADAGSWRRALRTSNRFATRGCWTWTLTRYARCWMCWCVWMARRRAPATSCAAAWNDCAR